MRLAIGSDHAGLHLKAQLAEHMRGLGHDVVDVGPHDTTSVDYPDYAHALTGLLSEGAIDRGVLICGTGLGMSMAANKRPGVRAAVVSD